MTCKISYQTGYGVWQKGKIQGWLYSFQTLLVEVWSTKTEKTLEVPLFILGQLSSKSLLDIQMEILDKKLDIRLGFRGEVWPGNKNDQFRYGNQSLETRCDHTGRMQIEKRKVPRPIWATPTAGGQGVENKPVKEAKKQQQKRNEEVRCPRRKQKKAL